MNKSNKKRNLFDDKRVLGLAALLLSVFFWIIVAGFISTPKDGKTTRNVVVNYTLKEDAYKRQGLVIVGELVKTVEVGIKGNDSVIKSLSSNDIQVTLDYSIVNGPGVYNLDFSAKSLSLGNFDISGVKPGYLTVKFESVETKTLTIVGKAEKVEAAAGYFKDSLVLSSTTIDITGPESQVAKVAQAVAVISDQEIRSQSKYYTGVHIRLLDERNDELDRATFTLSVSEIEVKVPILEVRTFPITVGISGQPPGFDIEWFKAQMELSATTIQIAGDSEELDKITEFEVGILDLSTFEFGVTYEFAVTLRKEFKNYDALKLVKVSINTDDFEQKTFTVPAANVRVTNISAGLSIVPVEAEMQVTIVGPTNVLRALLAENIIVQVDAFDISAEKGGQQIVAARILVASNNKVFALGSYEVVCDVRKT